MSIINKSISSFQSSGSTNSTLSFDEIYPNSSSNSSDLENDLNNFSEINNFSSYSSDRSKTALPFLSQSIPLGLQVNDDYEEIVLKFEENLCLLADLKR